MNACTPTKTTYGRCCVVTVDNLSCNDWEKRYQDGKTGWDRGQANPHLEHWLAQAFRPPQSILVPGCGRGHEVVALAKAGFQVTGVDFADSAVNALRSRCERESLENVEIIQADLFAFAPTQQFDAVYEQTCLCAIHPTQWRTYEQLLTTWLRPGGSLLALFMQSHLAEGPPFHRDLDAMRDLFAFNRWEWSTPTVEVPHPTGMREFACLLRLRETIE